MVHSDPTETSIRYIINVIIRKLLLLNDVQPYDLTPIFTLMIPNIS